MACRAQQGLPTSRPFSRQQAPGRPSPSGSLRLACRTMARFCRGCASMGPSMWCTMGTPRNSAATAGSWPKPALRKKAVGKKRREKPVGMLLRKQPYAAQAWHGCPKRSHVSCRAATHQSKASGSSLPASCASSSCTCCALRRRTRSAAVCCLPPCALGAKRGRSVEDSAEHARSGRGEESRPAGPDTGRSTHQGFPAAAPSTRSNPPCPPAPACGCSRSSSRPPPAGARRPPPGPPACSLSRGRGAERAAGAALGAGDMSGSTLEARAWGTRRNGCCQTRAIAQAAGRRCILLPAGGLTQCRKFVRLFQYFDDVVALYGHGVLLICGARRQARRQGFDGGKSTGDGGGRRRRALTLGAVEQLAHFPADLPAVPTMMRRLCLGREGGAEQVLRAGQLPSRLQGQRGLCCTSRRGPPATAPPSRSAWEPARPCCEIELGLGVPAGLCSTQCAIDRRWCGSGRREVSALCSAWRGAPCWLERTEKKRLPPCAKPCHRSVAPSQGAIAGLPATWALRRVLPAPLCSCKVI